MTQSSKSVIVFGIYMTVVGLALLIIPNPIITLVGFAEVADVWVRMFGWMLISAGFLYYWVGRTGEFAFARATVPIRFAVIVVHILLVILESAPPILIVFGAVDVLGALWTAVALRFDNA